MTTEWLGKAAGILAVAGCVVALWFLSAQGVIVLPWQDPTVGAPAGRAEGGSIVMRPQRYEQELLKERWVQKIPVGDSTFGKLLVQQARFSIEGSGPIGQRRITADTRSAAGLLQGKSEQRTERFLHGMQELMQQRDAYVKGVSLSRSKDGFTANWLVIFVRSGLFDAFARNEQDQRQLVQLLIQYSDMVRDAWAWFEFDSAWIVMGPQMSRPLEQALRNPQSVSEREQLRIAYIIRHEIEHAVSAYDLSYDSPREAMVWRWLEEGSADTLSRWPGVATDTAKMFGLRYPKRAEKMAYDEFEPGASGYDDYVFVMRRLLTLAGIDVRQPDQLAAAQKLLQREDLPKVPGRIARRIAEGQGMSGAERAWLEREIRALDGKPSRMRTLERELTGR